MDLKSIQEEMKKIQNEIQPAQERLSELSYINFFMEQGGASYERSVDLGKRARKCYLSLHHFLRPKKDILDFVGLSEETAENQKILANLHTNFLS